MHYTCSHFQLFTNKLKWKTRYDVFAMLTKTKYWSEHFLSAHMKYIQSKMDPVFIFVMF